jgi:ABC-type antimicrobial peptide transport system permease subunit
MQTLDDVVASSLGASRVNVRLLQAFGEVAMVLCGIGVYAVTAFSARARRRELAIRLAFGASRRELVALLLRDELRPVVIGLGLGYAVALAVAPHLGALLFTASPWDLPTYALMGLGMLAITGFASYVPARRAGRTDPVELLRS